MFNTYLLNVVEWLKWGWGKIRLGIFQLEKGRGWVEPVRRLMGPIWGKGKKKVNMELFITIYLLKVVSYQQISKAWTFCRPFVLAIPFSRMCTRGFPGGAVVENLPANAGDTGSSPGLGRSHMPRSNWAREPQLLSLRIWSLCSATRGHDSERPAHCDEEWSPLATTRESPHTETKTQHSHKLIN